MINLDVEKIHSHIVRQLESWVETMPSAMQRRPLVGFAAEGEELTPRDILRHVREGTDFGNQFVEHAAGLVFSEAGIKMAEGALEEEPDQEEAERASLNSPENTLAARRDLENSLALDPNSAEGWAELANVLMLDFLYGWNNASKAREFVKAEEAVQKAYAIDRSVALAHVVEGRVRRVKGDHQGALDAFDEALQLDPNLVTALTAKAGQLTYLGRAQEAPALVKKAIDLSPRDPDLGRSYFIIGRAYFAMKDYDNAISWLQKSVTLMSTTWFIRTYLISAYALTGRLAHPEAQAASREYREGFKDWPLDPKIKEYCTEDTYRDAHPAFRAMIHELLRGLQIAKETSNFP